APGPRQGRGPGGARQLPGPARPLEDIVRVFRKGDWLVRIGDRERRIADATPLLRSCARNGRPASETARACSEQGRERAQPTGRRSGLRGSEALRQVREPAERVLRVRLAMNEAES